MIEKADQEQMQVAGQFRAIVAEEVDGKVKAALRELTLADLPDEDVLVDVAYSTLNYKDGLAVSGRGKICRKFPMVCGADLVGTVAESRNPKFVPGDKVLVNGFGMSERFWGGYSQKQRVKSEWLVRAPAAFTLAETMAIGTAGYTAMLCVMALEESGVAPGAGPVVVTGASGGVGSVAVMLLSKLGYEVVAASGRAGENEGFLRDLGASRVISRAELARTPKPLEAETWAGGVDAVGGETLATVLAQTRYGGAVAACGLAGGPQLPTTVMPFILRGVTLRGVDSVMAPMPRREQAWRRLSELVDKEKLAALTSEAPLARVLPLAHDILDGKVRGRVVVNVNA